MPHNTAKHNMLDMFRGEWVRGHLDYQRAVEALEAARHAAGKARTIDERAHDSEEARSAEQNVERAGRRLAEIEAALAAQFDRFCGVAE